METITSHPLPFFPTLLPDESLHSLISRFHRLSGNPRERQTLQDVFGTHALVATASLPSHLPNLCAALPVNAERSLDQLIDQWTLLPYFRPFLRPEQVLACLQAMTSHSAGGTKIGIGLVASRIGGRNVFRYCDQCCIEDEMRYGSPYWHRAHSLPGVLLCHLHGRLLAEVRADLVELRRHNLFLPTDSWVEMASSVLPIKETLCDDLLELAKASADLLAMQLPPTPRPVLRSFYREQATQQGWIDRNDRIEHTAVIRAANRFSLALGPEPDLGFCKIPDWIFRHLYKHRTTMHPLKHLVLMVMLRTSPSALQAYCEGPDKSADVRIPAYHGTPPENELSSAFCSARRQRFLEQISSTPARRAHDYMWLYKHDRQWLRETISRYVKPRAAVGDKVAWHVRDREYAEQIRHHAELLYDSNVRTRISAAQLARATGRKPLIEKFSTKLPLTIQAIQALEETVDAYQCRRLRAIAQESRAKGEPLVRWRLLRAAGLTCPLAPQVEKLLAVLLKGR